MTKSSLNVWVVTVLSLMGLASPAFAEDPPVVQVGVGGVAADRHADGEGSERQILLNVEYEGVQLPNAPKWYVAKVGLEVGMDVEEGDIETDPSEVDYEFGLIPLEYAGDPIGGLEWKAEFLSTAIAREIEFDQERTITVRAVRLNTEAGHLAELTVDDQVAVILDLAVGILGYKQIKYTDDATLHGVQMFNVGFATGARYRATANLELRLKTGLEEEVNYLFEDGSGHMQGQFRLFVRGEAQYGEALTAYVEWARESHDSRDSTGRASETDIDVDEISLGAQWEF